VGLGTGPGECGVIFPAFFLVGEYWLTRECLIWEDLVRIDVGYLAKIVEEN